VSHGWITARDELIDTADRATRPLESLGPGLAVLVLVSLPAVALQRVVQRCAKRFGDFHLA
jgi:hypothetical protein